MCAVTESVPPLYATMLNFLLNLALELLLSQTNPTAARWFIRGKNQVVR